MPNNKKLPKKKCPKSSRNVISKQRGGVIHPRYEEPSIYTTTMNEPLVDEEFLDNDEFVENNDLPEDEFIGEGEFIESIAYLVDVIIPSEVDLLLILYYVGDYDKLNRMAEILNGDRGINRRGADGKTIVARNSDDLVYQVLGILTEWRDLNGDDPNLRGLKKQLDDLLKVNIEEGIPDIHELSVTFYEDSEVQRRAELIGLDNIYVDFPELTPRDWVD